MKQFKNDFKDNYLKSIEKQMLVLKSDKGMLEIERDVSPEYFKQIADQVFIKFKPSTKDQFKVADPVVLHLQVKNVPELRVQVFQFNTETYYKKTMMPFDTSIDLHGMVPNIEKVLTDEFKGVPTNKITEVTITLDELKGQVGTYVIELFGNGIKSRAVVKKGSLTLVHRSTEAGHIGYILDEQKQICNSDNTGVWLNNEFFPCDRSNGAIFIPYQRYQENMKVIMIHENFAQLTDFCRDTERYEFEVFFHANTEQFIEGHQATILIRPKLLINSHRASLSLLTKNKAYLSIQSVATTPITRIFDNLQFKDDEETLITF